LLKKFFFSFVVSPKNVPKSVTAPKQAARTGSNNYSDGGGGNNSSGSSSSSSSSSGGGGADTVECDQCHQRFPASQILQHYKTHMVGISIYPFFCLFVLFYFIFFN
jgi:hypothetical protein